MQNPWHKANSACWPDKMLSSPRLAPIKREKIDCLTAAQTTRVTRGFRLFDYRTLTCFPESLLPGQWQRSRTEQCGADIGTQTPHTQTATTMQRTQRRGETHETCGRGYSSYGVCWCNAPQHSAIEGSFVDAVLRTTPLAG